MLSDRDKFLLRYGDRYTMYYNEIGLMICEFFQLISDRNIKEFISDDDIAIIRTYSPKELKYIPVETLDKIRDIILIYKEKIRLELVDKVNKILIEKDDIINYVWDRLDVREKNYITSFRNDSSKFDIDSLQNFIRYGKDIIMSTYREQIEAEQLKEDFKSFGVIEEFIRDYQVELNKFVPNNLSSREMVIYKNLKQNNLYFIRGKFNFIKGQGVYCIDAKKATWICENVIPKLKTFYEEYHSKRFNMINSANTHLEKILNNPAYKIVFEKLSDGDKKLLSSFVTSKENMDQQQVRLIITKIIPVMLSYLKKLSPIEQAAASVYAFVMQYGNGVASILSDEDRITFDKIKNNDFDSLSLESINSLLLSLESLKSDDNLIDADVVPDDDDLPRKK